MAELSSSTSDLTDEEYRRECTLRNPAFIKDQREFLKRWASEQDLFAEAIVVARRVERGRGLEAIAEQRHKQRQYLSEAIKLGHKWPSVTLGDIIGEASGAAGPKIQVLYGSYHVWPRDGSVLLRVDPTATGDEIKQQWLNIKKGLKINERQSRADKALRIRIYDRYYRDGRNFHQIAKEAGKSVSSVYGLLISACKSIGRVRDPNQKRMDPGFDLQEHFTGCPQCKSGRLCRLAEKKTGVVLSHMRELSIPKPTYPGDDPDDN